MRHNWKLAVLLAVAFVGITRGLFLASDAVGWIGGGVLLAVWSVLFVMNVPDAAGSGGDE